MTPILAGRGLFLFMEPTSPKGTDLTDRGWFALHNGVPDDAGTGGEFSVGGIGLTVDDDDTRSLVVDKASYAPADRYVLFELRLNEARCLGYGDVSLPSTPRWSVAS